MIVAAAIVLALPYAVCAADREGYYAVVLNPVNAVIRLPGEKPNTEPDNEYKSFPFPGLPSIANLGDVEEERFVDSQTSDRIRQIYDLPEIVRALMDSLDDDAAWEIEIATEYPLIYDPLTGDEKTQFASSMLRDELLTGVMFFDFSFSFEPRLDQIRVRVTVDIVTRGVIGKKWNGVVYEYLSSSQGLVLRKWRPGEKEELIAAVEETYREKLERWPHNKKAYARDRRAALKVLERRDSIFEDTAISEGWTNESITQTVVAALVDLNRYLHHDLKSTEPDKAKDKDRVEFVRRYENGRARTVRGYVREQLDDRIVYNDLYGSVFSFPQAEQSEAR